LFLTHFKASHIAPITPIAGMSIAKTATASAASDVSQINTAIAKRNGYGKESKNGPKSLQFIGVLAVGS